MAVMAAQGYAAPIEIILDNPSATLVGTWATGTTASGRYGSDYYWCAQSTSGGRTATYTPSIPVTASDWEVYSWYPAGTNRPTQAEYLIHSAGGDYYVYVNQQINGGQWVQVGTYSFLAGTSGYARITNRGDEGKNVMADAFRFYCPSGGVDTIPPTIFSVAAEPDYKSATIRWSTNEAATSQVEYGLTAAYGSQTAKKPGPAMQHIAYVTGLSPATTYHYRVKSEDSAGNLGVSGDFTFATTSAPKPEYRAMWVDTWGEGILNPSQVTTLVNTAKTHNYNVIIPEIRKAGDAYYDSAYEPRATNITQPLPWDPLQDLITKAHAEGIEVHAWIVTYRIWRVAWGAAPPYHMWTLHPEWVMLSKTGEDNDGSSYFFDPGVPQVQRYVCEVVKDIVGKYEIDGFNFDYIRYMGAEWGYNPIARQRFYNEYGYYPPTSDNGAQWDNWCDYRRTQVTDLVRKCYLEATKIRPQIKMSACLTGGGGLYPTYDFTNTSTYYDVFQNWPAWAEEGILDLLTPMGYKDEDIPTSARDYRDWTDFFVDHRYGRHMAKGQGAYMNSIENSIIQMQYARDAGADGMVTYSYRSTNDEGRPNSEFYNAVSSTVFASPAAIPEMPWKTNPTGGIIFGTVTKASGAPDPIYWQWLYKATVSISGPVTLNTVTDATGTYGFIDLPPGTYTVTYSKTGYPNRVISGLELSAGQVIRRDVALGTVTVTSPAGVVVNGWSLFSLPVDPVNPDPASVMNGIDIDGRLYGWNNATQSLTAYDVWSPEAFGNMNVENGYWLDSNSAGAISYEGYPSNATARDIPLSKSGWAIIGCPFTSNKQWPDTAATHGGQTVPLSTAVYTNNWLTSIGYWWDATVQSLSDIGLPEDFPSSETLQPWHGYWIQTNVDDLTLRLR